MARADVYVRKDVIYVVALAETTKSITLETDDITTLARPVEPTPLGQAVLRALQHYQEGIVHEQDWRHHDKAMLRALGLKTRRSFEKGTCLIAVRAEESHILVSPTKPYGRGGYLSLTLDEYPDGGIMQCVPEPYALGEAILSRIPLATPHPE